MSSRLTFDAQGVKCYKLMIFYCLCGHVETSYLHTALCLTSICGGLRPGRAGLPFCWCQFPLGKHLAYCVGKCYTCQTEEEPGVTRANEPHRHVQRGTQARVGWTRRPYSPEKIRDLARTWRGLVEEQERNLMTRTETLKREREAERRRQEREIRWNHAWEQHKRETDQDYQAPIVHGDAAAVERQTGEMAAFLRHRRAKILDLTDDFSRPRTTDDLLEIASGVNLQDDCAICTNTFSQPSLFSDDGAEDFVVRFQGGCGHAFHRQCIVTQLTMDKSQCPTCRALHRFVLKNGFDDPKFRWILENPRDTLPGHAAKHRLWRVAGYIPFEKGLTGDDFKVYEKEDRWGDLEDGLLNS